VTDFFSSAFAPHLAQHFAAVAFVVALVTTVFATGVFFVVLIFIFLFFHAAEGVFRPYFQRRVHIISYFLEKV